MSSHEPYIVYLSSDAAQLVFEKFQGNYPAHSIVSFCANIVGSEIAQSLGIRAMFNPQFAPAAEKAIRSSTLTQLQPVFDEINARGAPPLAVISCPYFAKALLVDSISGEEAACPIMHEFNGKVALLCTIDEWAYRQALPELFSLNHPLLTTEIDSGRESIEQFLRERIEAAGIPRLPEAARGLSHQLPDSEAFVDTPVEVLYEI